VIYFKGETVVVSREEVIKLSGHIQECLPSAMFRVKLENDHIIVATLGGKLRQNNIRIALGDEVEVEMSPYDFSRGRIVYRTR
jgi:translation initiation factor IF-1